MLAPPRGKGLFPSAWDAVQGLKLSIQYPNDMAIIRGPLRTTGVVSNRVRGTMRARVLLHCYEVRPLPWNAEAEYLGKIDHVTSRRTVSLFYRQYSCLACLSCEVLVAKDIYSEEASSMCPSVKKKTRGHTNVLVACQLFTCSFVLLFGCMHPAVASLYLL